MSTTRIVLNGRNVQNIIAEAEEAFGAADETVCLLRDGDALPAPEGTAAIPIGQFSPFVVPGRTFQLVANGGTTRQLVLALKALVMAGAPFAAWDLQKGEAPVLVWEYPESAVIDGEYEYAVMGYDSSPLWGTCAEAEETISSLGWPVGVWIESRQKVRRPAALCPDRGV